MKSEDMVVSASMCYKNFVKVMLFMCQFLDTIY